MLKTPSKCVSVSHMQKAMRATFDQLNCGIFREGWETEKRAEKGMLSNFVRSPTRLKRDTQLEENIHLKLNLYFLQQ